MTVTVAPGTRFKPAAVVAEDVFGDSAATFLGSARNQSFVYAGGADARVFGDAPELARTAVGGRDSFTATGVGSLWGDAETLTGSARGGNDTIRATGPADPADGRLFVYGDGNLTDRASGGDDIIRVRGSVTVYGEGESLGSSRAGGNDVVVARGDGATIYGDASFVGAAHCGNDRITVHGHAGTVSGDSQYLTFGSLGGNDRIVVSGSAAELFGDASIYLGFGGIGAVDGSRGGNDVLVNKGATGLVMTGDASLLHDATHGGNDTLIGGDGGDRLRGDAQFVFDGSTCGSDVLAGGRGDDTMFGDAEGFSNAGSRGADRFVFAADSGHDVIGDFEVGKDKIDVSALGLHDLGDLTITPGTDTAVQFSSGNDVILAGVAGVAAGDFIFA